MEELNDKEIAEKYKETAEYFRALAVDMLKAFVFIEERLKGAAQSCIDLADMLDPPEETTINLTEGDINVN